MSRTSYDLALEENMARRLSREPELAKTVAEILGRLRNGDFYEPVLVEAVFQKWDRYPITFADAYGFMLAYTNILIGRWGIARVTVGDMPLPDKEIEGNNARLQGLNPQFGAEFEGGAGDHDGSFWWHDHLHLERRQLVGDQLVKGPLVTVGPRRVVLEVGYQAVGKTLMIMQHGRGLARWPYDSEHIWVFYDCSGVFSEHEVVEKSCVYNEERGWPCAYSRKAL